MSSVNQEVATGRLTEIYGLRCHCCGSPYALRGSMIGFGCDCEQDSHNGFCEVCARCKIHCVCGDVTYDSIGYDKSGGEKRGTWTYRAGARRGDVGEHVFRGKKDDGVQREHKN